MAARVFGVDGLQALIDALAGAGYLVYGPTVRDGVITPAPITSTAQLPLGVRDQQSPGRYRLAGAEPEAEPPAEPPGTDPPPGAGYFDHAATATSWKPLLFPARRALWRFGGGGAPVPAEPDRTRRALLGVRSCDLRALHVLDRALADRPFRDPDYVARRAETFLVVVTCGHPAGTCFCASMGAGPAPQPGDGFDVALTELHDRAGHRFVAEAGSPAGAGVLAGIPTRPAQPADGDAVRKLVDTAVVGMRRHVDTRGIRDLLYANAEHPRWDEVASRCLGCTNCTLVCPTCFCVTTTEVADLTEPVGRDRVWDSCFNAGHSQLPSGPLRHSTRARYRQWLTHKFGSWIDQFDTSGCVGCGRCITWCPAGIDVTEELAALRTSATAAPQEAP